MGGKDFCCVINCHNGRLKNKRFGEKTVFCAFPMGKSAKACRKRNLWLKAIRRDNFVPTASTRVCGRHFVSGFQINDPSSVDYVPSLNLGYEKSVRTRLIVPGRTNYTDVSNLLAMTGEKERRQLSGLLAPDIGAEVTLGKEPNVRPILLVKSAFAPQSDCIFGQQHECRYNPDAEEEFKIEVNPEWQPDNESYERDSPDIQECSIEPMSRDDMTEIQQVHQKDKEEIICNEQSSDESLGDGLFLGGAIGQKIATAASGKTCCKPLAERGGQNSASGRENADALQMPTEYEAKKPPNFVNGRKPGNKQSLSKTSGQQTVMTTVSDTATAVSITPSTRGGNVSTGHLPTQNGGNKVIVLITFSGRVPGMPRSSTMSLNMPAAQNTLVVPSSGGEQSKQSPGKLSGEKIILQTTADGEKSHTNYTSAECSSQNLICGPGPTTEDSGVSRVEKITVQTTTDGKKFDATQSSPDRSGQKLLMPTTATESSSITSAHKPSLQTTVGGEKSDVVQSSLDCSIQKFLMVPSATVGNSAGSIGQERLNTGITGEAVGGQVPAEQGQKTVPCLDYNRFVCLNCGTCMVGRQVLAMHLLTCFMKKSLELTPVLTVVQDSPTVPVMFPVKTMLKGANNSSASTKSSTPIRERVRKDQSRRCKAEPFLCAKCGKQFKSRSYFDIHLRTHETDKPFTCDQCPKTFKFIAKLRVHQRRHSGERPFQCSRCAKKFFEWQHLKNHLQTHAKNGPIKCPECPATFNVPSNFKIHMRIHKGERPFSCKFCSKAFRDVSSLNVHLRIHTSDKPYKCEVCAAAFQRPSSLKNHIQVSHAASPPFVCSYCGVPFGTKGILKRHMRFHSRTMDRQDTPESGAKLPHYPIS